MKKKYLIFSLLAVILISATVISYSNGVSEDLSQNILRLHVIANSDSEEDQRLKLAVRDRILSESRALFAESTSIEETRQLLHNNTELLTAAAQDEIQKNNYAYPVKIETGEYDFPMKVYEDYALPCGRYEAVRVEIGDSNGKNWWCVMFPPLCFVDAASDKAEAAEYLNTSLREDEVSLISTRDGFDVRFKIVDIIEASVSGIRTALNR